MPNRFRDERMRRQAKAGADLSQAFQQKTAGRKKELGVGKAVQYRGTMKPKPKPRPKAKISPINNAFKIGSMLPGSRG